MFFVFSVEEGQKMIISSILIFFILSSFFISQVSADSEAELRTQLLDKARSENLSINFLQNQREFTQAKSPNKKKEPSYTNTISLELKWSLLIPIIFHQKVITVQDGQTCTFIPSCSAYGYEAIKRYGLLGVLMTADRLLRDYPGNRQYYPSIRNYAYDPVPTK